MGLSRIGVRMVLAGTAALGLLTVLPPVTANAAAGDTGYDISYPQCSGSSVGSTPASTGAFDILGVNDGIVYSANPCLAAQYKWATGATVSFYANTADPGPSSSHWPKGQTRNGVLCPNQKRYTIGSTAYNNCSYVYGWNAAQDSFNDASKAAGSSAAVSAQWWLDVESANSWTRSTTANIADIQGGLDYFSKNSAAGGGIYTNSSSWSSITGSTTSFSQYPWWYPTGQGSATTAISDCSARSILGGHIRYTQYSSNGFDTDYDCG
ncbi:MAG TPA: hypothetical protein VFH58_03340 [Acidimicrobiales bacterium]|nr:hypothetical protein [Acidimicrobiales bacterium]